MYDIPGFNANKMTDDELMQTQLKLSQRLGMASRFGSGDMVEQLSNMIQVIEAERRDRMLLMIFKYQQKLRPQIIESEPDLVVQPDETEDEADQKMRNRKRIGKERILKSSIPTRGE